MLSFELLQALLSPDARIREQAETVFRSMAVLDRVQGLTNFLVSSPTDHESALLLTAVLLRRDVLKLEDGGLLEKLVAPLLESFGRTKEQPIKVAIGHCLAEIGSCLSLMGSPSSAKVVSQMVDASLATVAGGDPSEILCSLKLLAALADRAPVAFAKVGIASLEGLTTSLLTILPNQPQLWTRLLEVIVNASVATTIEEVSLVRGAEASLDELVVDPNAPSAKIGMVCLLPVLKVGRKAVSLESLQCLSHAVVTCPSLVCGSLQVLEAFAELCLGISGDVELSLAALEAMASLVSVGDVRHRLLTPTMTQTLAETMVPVCARIMASENEIDDEWIHEPASLVEDSMEDDHSSFAQSLLESFFQNLATPALTTALPLVEELLSQTQSQHLCAGLAVLECGLVAAPMALQSRVPEILLSAAKYAEATVDPRVRHQALRLLGAICETQPQFRKPIILETIAPALGSPIDKISALACQVLSSYCLGDGTDDSGSDDNVLPYLSDILQALIQGPLSKTDAGSVTTRVRAMTATACLAEVSKESFIPFYPHVMQGFMACLSLPQAEVAGAALQSLTIVGQAVGKEVFETDAHQILSGILPILSSDAPCLSSEELLSACARIASVLEEDFAPYLDAVLPSLYKIARAPADISIEEGSEQGLQQTSTQGIDDDDGSMTVAIPGKGFQRITINTAAILEKATNNRIMFELARALGATFGPKVQETIDVFLPLTKFAYSSDVRSTAAQALSALFDAACDYAEGVGNWGLPQQYLPLLSDAISEQIASEDPSDMEALYALADSLSEVYYIAHRNNHTGSSILQNLPMAVRVEVVQRCMKTMKDCLGRRDGIARILEGNLSGEDEQAEYAGQLTSEDSLLTPLVDSIGYLLKFSKADFCPFFEQYIVPNLGKYLCSTTDARASLAAMCLFDDVVEHCGPQAAEKYSPSLLQGVMVVMSDPSRYERDLVQAAVYGIAQMSRYAPAVFRSNNSSTLQTIVHQLQGITQGTKEDAGDGVYLYEIAVSALASLVLFGPCADLKFVNTAAIQDIFLKSLPLQEDEDEAKVCHAGLCHLIETGSIDLGVEGPRIVQIAGLILSDVQDGNGVASTDTCERLMKVLYDIQNQNPQSMQQVYASLDPSVQNIVGYAIQDVARSRSSVVTP